MKISNKHAKIALYTTRGAMVAALYVLLTLLSAVFGLASGTIQFRLSEMLCILPIFMPEAIVGLFIGCGLANLITGSAPWDIVLGSIATLLGALGAYLMRKFPKKLKWLSTLPTILANAIIVPPVLILVYQDTNPYYLQLLFVTIGEVVCAGILGSMLYYTLDKTKVFKR